MHMTVSLWTPESACRAHARPTNGLHQLHSCNFLLNASVELALALFCLGSPKRIGRPAQSEPALTSTNPFLRAAVLLIKPQAQLFPDIRFRLVPTFCSSYQDGQKRGL